MDVKEKNIIVTGGANGIGLTLVERLVQDGAHVGVFDVNQEALGRLTAAHRAVHGACCDVTDCTQVKAEVDRFFEARGSIDVLVNNAGFIFSSPLVRFGKDGLIKHDIETWDKVIRTDLSAVFYMTVHVVEKMLAKRTKGVVINISSISAGGNAGQGAYSAAKAGVNALTVAWAKELGPMRIRFVGIAPGFTKTETTIQAVDQTVLDSWVKQTPSRRLGQPAEIADAITFAIRNDFINGRTIEVDGGLRM
jgi:3-oxoacyl-[acyl-carrier protein] reductase